VSQMKKGKKKSASRKEFQPDHPAWEEARTQYMSGKSPDQIAAILGLPVSRLKKTVLAHGWFREREELKRKSREAADAAIFADRKKSLENAVRQQRLDARMLRELAHELRIGGIFSAQNGLFLATMLGKVQEIERKALEMDEDDDTIGETPLQAVLRRMRESGKIAAPTAVEGSPEAATHAEPPRAD
jgi:hypothetical protein